MKILFINYHHLNSNSGIHIFNLANHLSRLGMDCTVCVPSQKETVTSLGKPEFETLNFSDLLDEKQRTAPDPQAQRALIIALGLCAITGVVAPLMAWRARPRRFEPGARTRC